MPHWRQNHQTEEGHLTNADLYDEAESDRTGKPCYRKVVVEIERMTVELLKSREKPKGDRRNVAYFKGQKKGLGLNVTNAEVLASLSGHVDPRAWVGLVVGLYVDPNAKQKSGKTGPAVRISSKPLGKGTATTPLPEVAAETKERLEREHEARVNGEDINPDEGP